ncbi:MAG: hypothetical protein JXQ76_09415 [Campylobacterales bacterium]|nr:hypothetical protein [Campylobacterales bacterium]
MRIFLVLLLSLPLLAKTLLQGDIDGDGKMESMELRNYGSNEIGTFYQLIVKDDDGKVLWKARENYDDGNPYTFVEAHHGISMPQILADIDNDGKMELLAPLAQGDVSPTYFKKLKWVGRRFTIMPTNALMMQSDKRFVWQETQAYQGTWVSGFISVEGDLIKANVISYINDEAKTGVALLRFDSQGAKVERWIMPLGSGYENRESEPSVKPTANNNQVELSLKLIVNYSSAAKAKLESSGERLIASLMLNEYDKGYAIVEGVAMKEAKFSTKYDVGIHRMDIQKGHRFDPSKNYKVNINIYTAREVFENNLVDCRTKDYQIDFDYNAIQGGAIEFTCKLIGE